MNYLYQLNHNIIYIMGNHSFDKLPHLLTKNWQPISTRSNSFRNKLTN